MDWRNFPNSYVYGGIWQCVVGRTGDGVWELRDIHIPGMIYNKRKRWMSLLLENKV